MNTGDKVKHNGEIKTVVSVLQGVVILENEHGTPEAVSLNEIEQPEEDRTTTAEAVRRSRPRTGRR